MVSKGKCEVQSDRRMQLFCRSVLGHGIQYRFTLLNIYHFNVEREQRDNV